MSSVFYGFALQNLSSWKAKPMVLVSKTIGFGKTKGDFFAYLHVYGLKTLNLKILQLCAFFGVFSDKIFFCSEFSSFEGVNWGFLEVVCQKFSKGKPPPNLPLGGGMKNLPLSPPEGKGTEIP